MIIKKHIPASMLQSSRETTQEVLKSRKFLRDRNDVYLLDLDSIQENFYDMRVYFEYQCLEIKINPDFDW